MKNNIKQIRKELGMRQEDLAHEVGATRQTIIAIENDKYNPTLELAMKLARVLNTQVEELLMRGFCLELLKSKYGIKCGLIVSTILFALLHFNMVQTLSALITGFILGLLYLKTKSLTSTILAHGLYNFISLVVLILF